MPNVFTKAWDQANLWDNNRTWKNPAGTQAPAAPAAPVIIRTGGGMTTSASPQVETDWKKQLADATANYNRLLNSMPKPTVTPYFDVMGNYTKAQQQAAANVSPLFQKKFNDFVSRQQIELGRTQTDTATNKSLLQTELDRTLQDTGLKRTRTGEDVATNIGQINLQEGQFQDDEGQQFAEALTGVRSANAEAGLTFSGLGARAEDKALTNRNTASERQVQQYADSRQAQEQLKTRTFEDLFNVDSRATEDKTTKTKALDLNLERFIEDQGLEKEEFRLQNESERLGAIIGQTGEYEKAGAREFVASLRARGFSPAEIDAATRSYL